MKKKLLFIYNPRSGKGKIRNKLMDIIDVFTKEGFETIIHPTQEPGDAAHVIRDHADAVDRVICSGGDGTLDEVVRAILDLDSDIPVGYIPTGSTNDFARSLRIPRDLAEAARVAATGKTQRVDIGSFNDTGFVYVAAFGVLTDVAYKTDQNLKNTIGYLAYLLEAGKQIFKIPKIHVRAEIDGQQVEGTFAFGMITNAHSVGGLKNVTGGNVDMRDGLFEVTLVDRPKNPIEFSEILASMLSANGRSPRVHEFKGREILIRTEKALDWTLDGEYGGNFDEVRIKNLHNRLGVYLDPPKKQKRDIVKTTKKTLPR